MPADMPAQPCETADRMLKTPSGSDESVCDWTMNVVSDAQSSLALERSHAMFNRVLAGWALDVLRLQRNQRRALMCRDSRSDEHRSAA